MAKRNQYIVWTDGLTYRPRLDRRYAVIREDRVKFLEDADGRKYAGELCDLQTDDARRAREYADELNAA